MTAARLAAVLAALVVSGWFALGAVQHARLDRAEAIASRAKAPTAAQARRADAALDTAAFLNPDRDVALQRAWLRLRRGHPRAAVRIALAVERAEPQNIAAWSFLRFAAGPAGDAALARRAAAEMARLSPPLP